MNMRSLAAILLLVACTASYGQSFPVYDGTLYQGKPQLPLKPITIIYSGNMWRDMNRDNIPDAATIAALAKNAETSGIGVIDVEHWPVDQTGIPKYVSLLQQFKKDDPKVKFGYYAQVPMRDYWRAIRGEGTAPYKAWQQQNASTEPIAQLCDIIFPSLYTLYDDPVLWQKYAVAQIKEARRYGKPVYVFLWPEFTAHPGTYIPTEFWKMELETARKYADGIVIWGGENYQKWDDHAPWWQVTLNFLKTVQ
jgi:hypothetical protein